MELYLEDMEMMQGDLHWDLPGDVEAPSSSARRRRRRPRGVTHRTGVLLTIGHRPHALVEHVCTTPQQVVDVIRGFFNLTLLYINCHSIDDRGVSNVSQRGTVSGIRLGGARIYARHLNLFTQLQSNFATSRTEPLVAQLVYAGHAYIPARPASSRPPSVSCSSPLDIEPPWWHFNVRRLLCEDAPSPERVTSPAPVDTRITAQGFNVTHHLFVPRIVMRSCSIGQNQSFCQQLANAAGTYVFAPTVAQWARQTRHRPWQLHGPVRVFVPPGLTHLRQTSALRRAQMIAMGSGRGVGRKPGPIGRA